jgi:tetratricopeptide (TPR) repeat protein
LIHDAGPDLLAGGRIVTLSEWLDALPKEKLEASPELLSLKGSTYLFRGHLQESLDLFNEVVERLQTRSVVDLVDAYNRRSAVLRQAGDYAASLDDAENAIRLSKDKPELVLQYAEALRARGNLRILQGELKEALSDFSNSAAIYKKSSLDMDVAKVLIELGWVNRRLGQYEETEKDYTQALEILQANGNAILAANVLNNLGVLQYLLGQYELAVLTLDKALQYAKIASYPRMEGYTLNSLGDLYRELRSFQQAKAAYDQAWQVITAIQDKSLEMYQY